MSRVLCVLALAAFGCAPGADKAADSLAPDSPRASAVGQLPSREGFVQVEGGKVWYRIVGDGPGTPLLLLHGGPGVPSNYLNPMLALGDERRVILYDQLGTGKSDHPADTSLWHTERFVRELATVRDSLGLRDVHLYGHSWGTMLAAAYMATAPSGIRSVTFASPALSAKRWTADAESLKTLLPDSLQRIIADADANGTTDSPAYQRAVQVYYQKFVTVKPLGIDTDSAMQGIAIPVYMQMWGPSEFRATGSLKTFDATPGLSSITVPTLFTAGAFDEATPATTRYYASLVRGSEVAIIPDAAHITHNDNPTETVRVQRDFLRRVDVRSR